MSLLDGAVNGMMIRLTSAGFAPTEAFSLAQAAYIKAQNRDSSVLPTVVSRSEATWEIDQALKELGPYPMGVEAHRTRIKLWEKIFGFRSWHEPVDPLEVYTPLELLAHGYHVPEEESTSTPASVQTATEEGSETDTPLVGQMISGALRYFQDWSCEREDVTYLPASYFKQSRESKQRWEGLLLFAPEVCGFFEYSDCQAASVGDGSPLLFRYDELEQCSFWLQPELAPYALHERVRVWPSPDGDAYIQLKRKGYVASSFVFNYGEWPPEAHELLHDQFMAIIGGLSFGFSMYELDRGSK